MLTIDDPAFVASRYSPAIALDGTAYFTGRFSASDPAVIAVAPDGTERWRFSEPLGGAELRPILDGDGSILFSTTAGRVMAISAQDGSELWRLDLRGRAPERRIIVSRDGGSQIIDDQLPPIQSRIDLQDVQSFMRSFTGEDATLPQCR
ncbi:MAG: PQQ-binding-like beta-propeller repeat protein [Phycisphaerales bacterium]|nr:PQQ-binding-like beta-propeller repeat protein [Phycisphaerales bacterium]